VRAAEAVTPLSVVIPADIRFPLERANGVQIVKTAAALARAGCQARLLVRSSDPRSTDEILALYGLAPQPSLDVRRLGVMHRAGSFALPRASFLAQASALCGAALRGGGLVYTRDLQLADLLLGLGPLAAGPIVFEAHAVEAVMYGERGSLYGTAELPNRRKLLRLQRREERVWRRAAGLVATTRGILETLEETYGPRQRTRVIPNGCDVALSRAFPGLVPPEAEPRVLYAGQLYPWKGVDVLVAAVARLDGVRLVILGGFQGEADLERVRAAVRTHGLEDRTELLGTVAQSQVAAEMQRSSVIAVPFLRTLMTEKHTSPLKAFEAMAAGRPSVVSDLPSSREFLRDGLNALLVPPGDVAALAGAIRKLIEDRALAERLARTAWDEAPRYSWDARAARLVSLFEEVR
jgi:glycosyltransferase involved in cell wall biosynthesis